MPKALASSSWGHAANAGYPGELLIAALQELVLPLIILVRGQCLRLPMLRMHMLDGGK